MTALTSHLVGTLKLLNDFTHESRETIFALRKSIVVEDLEELLFMFLLCSLDLFRTFVSLANAYVTLQNHCFIKQLRRPGISVVFFFILFFHC